ncbi:hypothetical protein RhiirA1_485245, partial [Rhizophagus irregularis]
MVNTRISRNEELLLSINERIKANEDLRQSYQTDDPEKLGLLEKLDALEAEFYDLKDEVMSLAIKNQNTESYNLYVAEVAPLVNEIDDLYSNLINVNNLEAKTENEQNEKDISTSLILLISIIVGALVLYVGLSWVISQLISKPTKEMEKLMKKAERGDLTVQSTYQSKDEIGSLAQSFNEMLSQLNRLVKNVRDASNQVASSSEELIA